MRVAVSSKHTPNKAELLQGDCRTQLIEHNLGHATVPESGELRQAGLLDTAGNSPLYRVNTTAATLKAQALRAQGLTP